MSQKERLLRRSLFGLVIAALAWHSIQAAEAPEPAAMYGPPVLPPALMVRETAARLEIAGAETRQIRAVAEARLLVLTATRGHAPPALAAAVAEEAVRAGVDPLLLAAVAGGESDWNPFARGSSGELGLLQLLPSTARWTAPLAGVRIPEAADLLDPRLNARLGAAYLAYLLREFGGDETATLTAYNRGPAGARQYRLLHGHFRSSYAVRVLKHREELRRHCGPTC